MRVHIIGSMALGAALLALPGSATAADCTASIDTKIAAAKTAADHEAIAACFTEKAKAAQASAEEHKKMGEAYRKAGGAPVGKLHLPQHCDYFTKAYTDEAKTYEDMANAHRQMAKSAK